MVKSQLGRSTLREIKSSLGRFLAILAIIGLGVGFFAGLKVAKEAMVTTVEEYLDDHTFYDYRLLSTLGFDRAAVDYLAEREEATAVEGALSFDALYRLESGRQDVNPSSARDPGKQGVIKFHSLTQQLNTVELVAGRMPANDDECVVDSKLFGESDLYSLLKISEENDVDTLEHFSHQQYSIVGIVQSPLYLQYERGNTSLGSGRLDGFVYLMPTGFAEEYYTEIYVGFDNGYGLYSDGYDEYMDWLEPKWESYGEQAADLRYQSILSDAQQELNDAKEEFEEKKAEGEAELADAASTLADAETELADGQKALEDARQEIADGQETLREKEQELNDAKLTLAEKEAELADGESKFQEGIDSLTRNGNLLSEAKKNLSDQSGQLAAQKEQLAQSRAQMEKVQAILTSEDPNVTIQYLVQDLNSQVTALTQSREDLQGQRDVLLGKGELSEQEAAQLSQIESQLAEIDSQLQQAESQLALFEMLQKMNDEERNQWMEGQLAAISAGETQITAAEAQIAAGYQQISSGERELSSGWVTAANSKMELEDGRQAIEDAKQEIADGEQAIADAAAELADVEKTLAEKETELADALAEYEEGLQEYLDAQEEFNTKIADAEAEIADAEAELADLDPPDTYLLGRDTNVGYVCFENDSGIVEGIANIFPVFFILVAVLVCITTMNRMVEEQRTQIGVLKAIGYGESAIMSKYMVYSGLAAVAGSVIGYLLGTWGFPKVIWAAYGIMYSSADNIAYVFNWKLAVLMLAVGILCSLGTTWLSCRVELNQVAAQLMRPKAPKAGKRVFLEYVPFLWNRLSFLRKVSLRNIFRYKKRLFMMILGISGCTALLVTGFGIKDSIADIAAKQFEEIQTFDLGVTFRNPADDRTQEQIAELGHGVETYLCVMEKNMDLVTEKGVKSITLAAGDPKRMPEFVDLHTKTGESIPYPGLGEGVISDKLAAEYNIEAGDIITLRDENMRELTLTVTAVQKNYIYNYVHISEDTWEDQMMERPQQKTAYVNVAADVDVHETAAALMQLDNVSNVTVNLDTMERVGSMMASLDIIVVTVILCAAGLAFIVLYNLTNINITERIREIATLKVLGFYKRETESYVFRENLLLSLLGMALGLFLGRLLHAFVMSQIQIDMISFDMYVKPVSYLYSGLLTVGFAWFVGKAMGGKLESISMTESLKSVD